MLLFEAKQPGTVIPIEWNNGIGVSGEQLEGNAQIFAQQARKYLAPVDHEHVVICDMNYLVDIKVAQDMNKIASRDPISAAIFCEDDQSKFLSIFVYIIVEALFTKGVS